MNATYKEMPTRIVQVGQQWRNLHTLKVYTVEAVETMTQRAWVDGKPTTTPLFIATLNDGGRYNQDLIIAHWTLIK